MCKDTTPKKQRPASEAPAPAPLTPSQKRAAAEIVLSSPKRTSPVPDANPSSPKSPKTKASDESLSKVASPKPLAI